MTDSTHPKRILVADDHADTRRTLALMMEALGYTVDTVDNCDDVIPRVKGTRADLVVLDVMMPSKQALDGFEVCRRLKDSLGERCPKIVLLTAIGEGTHAEARKITEATGADRFIPKPYEPGELTAVVADLLKEDEIEG